MKRNRRTIMIMVGAAVLTVLAGVLAMPRPPQLAEPATGDQELIGTVRDQLGSGVRDRVSVAVIEPDGTRIAHFGAQPEDSYEIGSLTKTFTGSLLAIAIERDEVTANTRIGELLELGTGPVADITLEELATQTSGLPAVPSDPAFTLRSTVAALRASNPYPTDPQTMINAARETTLGTKEYRYSNLGFALLGEGLVAAAGAADYESLVAERITGPLQMSATRVATLADEPTGYTATGRQAGNWDMSGFAGAGSLRSTLGDLTGYLSAQADGSAPGVRATEPVKPVDGQQIGYAWMTTGDITWHNGKTGGFASFAGFDRQSGRAVVVLSNTAVPVDDLGLDLLEDRS